MWRDLVQRAMAHDHEAFSELARLTIDKLYAIARLILRDEHRAEDAVQEAMIACWRDIAALRDPDRFEAWQRRLLVHACYREARKDSKRSRIELHIPGFDQGAPDAAQRSPTATRSSGPSAP
jgi:RNA polymerase sigma factor (sigma-70 family)